MSSRQQIKQRIGSVKNTKQITRAMQLVAASKLRRAQDAAVGPSAYAEMARDVLTRLRQLAANESDLGLFVKRPVKTRTLIVVTSDLGLAGAYDGNVIRQMIQEVAEDRKNGIKTKIVSVGRKGSLAATQIHGVEVEASYHELPDKPSADQIRPILYSIVQAFINEEVDAVDIIYTHFVSMVRQDVEVQPLLPAGFQETELTEDMSHADIEPSAEVLIAQATERLVEAQVYQALLDAKASEHSMRMLAMKNATDNASDLIDDLTLAFNNARQSAITQELAEITGGAEAMK